MQLRLMVEYDGSPFQGWQIQSSGPTVQGELERAIGIMLRRPVRVHGGGRTDAGVHALGQVAAVAVSECPVDLGRFVEGVNANLPPEIAIVDAAVVDAAFDPRRDARRRRYAYHILNRRVRAPRWRGRAWHVRAPLDVDAMRAAAAYLVGRHDLESFRGADPQPPPTTVREIFRSEVARDDALIVYTIEATAFLKHMVRNVVGTLVEVGRGERPADDIPALLAARDRSRAAATAPAQGLVLLGIDY